MNGLIAGIWLSSNVNVPDLNSYVGIPMRLVVRLALSATKRSRSTCRSTSALSRTKPWKRGTGVSNSASRITPLCCVHVVVHRLGLHDAIAFAEDDVAFHVHFQRRVGRLDRGAAEIDSLAGAGPNHHAVGRNVDRAGKTHRSAIGRQPVDENVYAVTDDNDSLIVGGF